MDAEDADVDVDAGADAIEVTAEEKPESSVGSVEAVRAAVAVSEPMTVPEVEPTGHADVDTALERLRELGELPTGAHPDVYDGVHQRLQEVLAQIDHQDAGR